MGLFDFLKNNKKSTTAKQEFPFLDRDSRSVFLENSQDLSFLDKSYSKALGLLQKNDPDSERAGRQMMLDLCDIDGHCDPHVSMWMAEDYEAHHCLNAAAKWYEIAFKQGIKEAEAGYKRCYNPYNIDPYYNIDGTRGCATFHVKYVQDKEKATKQAYCEAISTLSTKSSEPEVSDCLKTIYQIASSYHNSIEEAQNCCVPEAQQWMGDFCETVQKDNAEAARWFKKAADNGNTEGARCYADMVISGRGVEKNEDEAVKYYHKAAEKGQLDSMFVLGQYYFKHGNAEKAKAFLENAAEQGYAPAQEMLNNINQGKDIDERPTYQAALDNTFSEIVLENDLSDNGLVEYFSDIYQPDDFCQNAFDYCNKQYAGKGQDKLTFEYNMTAFYGSICAVALWNKSNGYFLGKTAWNAIKSIIDVEFTDRHAEELLGTKNGEDKAEGIYGLIQQYMRISRAAMNVTQCDRAACIYAMRLAYKLGMLVAKRELSVRNKGFVREFIVSESKEITKDKTKNNTTNNFYTECIEKIHDAANKLGVATRGLIFIPELMPYGEKVVLSLLKDPFYRSEFSNDPNAYYSFIMSLCIDAGIVLGTKWHEDFSNLAGYVDKIIEVGPAEDAKVIMKKYLPQNLFCNQGNPFFSKMYPHWVALHEPYWKLDDPREYTFKLMLAAYQLGISLILEKFGF